MQRKMNPPRNQPVINQENIKASVEKWRLHDQDCGSAATQIAIVHERVKYLTTHMLANKNDASAKRGLQALVTQRRTLLDYLFRTNRKLARQMIAELGIRYREYGSVQTKEEKYGQFKNTKQPRKVVSKKSKPVSASN
jgi:small subunit ribosomal protein S15